MATLGQVEAAREVPRKSAAETLATERPSGGDLTLATARFRATFPDDTANGGQVWRKVARVAQTRGRVLTLSALGGSPMQPACDLEELGLPGCVPGPVNSEGEAWSCFPAPAALDAAGTAASASALLLETLDTAVAAVRALSGTAARSGEEESPPPDGEGAAGGATAVDAPEAEQAQEHEPLDEPPPHVVLEREQIRRYESVARTPSLRPGVKALDVALGVTLKLDLSGNGAAREATSTSEVRGSACVCVLTRLTRLLRLVQVESGDGANAGAAERHAHANGDAACEARPVAAAEPRAEADAGAG